MHFFLCLLSLFLVPSICLAGSSVESNISVKSVLVTVPISAAAYGTNDQLGEPFKVPRLLDNASRAGLWMSTQVIDLDIQNAGVQVVAFSQQPSGLGGDNNPFSIPDAAMDYLIGWHNSTSFMSATLSSSTSSNGHGMGIVSTAVDSTGKKTGDIWAVLKITSGTPTYTSTSSIKVRFNVQL